MREVGALSKQRDKSAFTPTAPGRKIYSDGSSAPIASPVAGSPAPAAAPAPANPSSLNPQRGTPSSFSLPELPPAAVPAPASAPAPAASVPAYRDTFGKQSYVKQANNAQVLDLAKQAIAKDSALKDTPFGKAVAEGKMGAEETKQLQQYLESKGYSVGPTGADGKYGPNTHQGLKNFLEGKAPAAPTTAPDSTPKATTDSAKKPEKAAEITPVDKGGDDKHTAVFDMKTGRVTLPDGTVLEAHSGRGEHRDKASSAGIKNTGPTPPGIYKLSPRESLFHGAEALRLTPINGTDAKGRTGLLAHPYMMKKAGDSHGCVVFKDYQKFLDAYKNGQIRQLRVVG